MKPYIFKIIHPALRRFGRTDNIDCDPNTDYIIEFTESRYQYRYRAVFCYVGLWRLRQADYCYQY